MANNKIVFGNTPLIDLTGDTATTDKVVSGVSFMGKNGQIQTGTMTAGGALVNNVNISIAGKTYQPPAWSSGSVEDIALALEYHYLGRMSLYDYWSIGDTRTVSLSAMSAMSPLDDTHVAQSVQYVFMDRNTKTLTTPISGQTKCAFVVGQKDCLIEKGRINYTESKYGWDSMQRRTWCNSTYKNAVPSDLRALFKQFQNVGCSDGEAGTITTSNDYFALPAEMEIWGTTTKGYPNAESSCTQFEYYKTASNRIKKVNGTNDTYWTRTVQQQRSTVAFDECFAYSQNNGTVAVTQINKLLGLAPFGVI